MDNDPRKRVSQVGSRGSGSVPSSQALLSDEADCWLFGSIQRAADLQKGRQKAGRWGGKGQPGEKCRVAGDQTTGED